jgi:Na+/serine symporter
MLRRMALVRSHVSENGIDTIIRVIRIVVVFVRSLLPVASYSYVDTSSPILVTLIMEVLHSSETSILTRASRRNIPENGILQYFKYICKPQSGLLLHLLSAVSGEPWQD